MHEMRSIELFPRKLDDLIALTVDDDALMPEKRVLLRNGLVSLLTELIELPLLEGRQLWQSYQLNSLKRITAEDAVLLWRDLE